MNKRKIFIIFALVLLSAATIAAVPMKQSDLVPLVIDNNTDDYVTIQLVGPQFYYLMVPSYSTKTFSISRADYPDQEFYSCGVFVNTTIDFTKKQTIVVPKCGTKAYGASEDKNPDIDAGKLVKLVRVTFTNPYSYNLVLYMIGPAEHVFFIEAGNSETYTIAQGQYDATIYGCYGEKTFQYYPLANKEKQLNCPIHSQ